MKSAYLYLTGLGLSTLLALALFVLWQGHVAAHATPGDFQPTYAPHEAAARVAAAQEQEQAARARSIGTHGLPHVPTVFFAQTGHHLSNRTGFLDFWRANGQALIFGYPITEEIVEQGKIVQYFERARFEYHPELAGTPQQVQLGLLGYEVLPEGVGAAVPDPQNGLPYFAHTGHTLAHHEFRSYWERRGGIDIFGYPLSEPLVEAGRTVQYFERARFVHFPEDMPLFYQNGLDLNTLFEVRPDAIGRQAVQERAIASAPVAQLPGAPEWSPALWERHIAVNLSTQWLTAYEGDLVVYRAPVATGRDGFNTPAGEFAIYDKLSMQTMQGSVPGESWYVPNIPWVMYVVGGVALHGTYWHNAFGSGARMSHGCINLGMDDAHWLYDWADIGTTVHIHY